MGQTKPPLVRLRELAPGQGGDFYALLAEKVGAVAIDIDRALAWFEAQAKLTLAAAQAQAWAAVWYGWSIY